MTRRNTWAVAALALGVLGPVNSQATGSSINVTLRIPVVCNTSFQSNEVDQSPSELLLGDLQVFCNSAHGYSVELEHESNLHGVSLVVDGRDIPLDDSGRTLILDSDSPSIRARPVYLRFEANASDVHWLQFGQAIPKDA